MTGTVQGLNAGRTSGAESSVPLRGPKDIGAKLASMTTAEKAKLLVMNYGDVNSAPWSGSVIVNQTHLGPETAPKLKRAVATASQRQGAPVLVAADQEGGRVNRMKKLPGYEGVAFPSPGEMQHMTPAQLRAEGAKVGRALKDAGVNMLLGPVLDSGTGTLMDRQGRSFGATPEQVLARAQPFIDGLREANPNAVLVAKHFPNYSAKGNSDIARVEDPATLAQLRAGAAPFLQTKGLDGVMMNSIRYPNVDNEPACFSPSLIKLARETNPNALIVTDDVAAAGLLSKKAGAFKNYEVVSAQRTPEAIDDTDRYLATYPEFGTPEGRAAMRQQVGEEIKQNAKKAFLAGCDVVLTMDTRHSAAVAQAIAELVQEKPELKAKLDVAATRMLQASLKGGGLLPSAPAAPVSQRNGGWQPPPA